MTVTGDGPRQEQGVHGGGPAGTSSTLEARYRLLCETSPEIVFVHDGARILDLGGGVERLLGFSVAEIIGRPIFGPWTTAAAREEIAARLAEGYEGRYRTRLRHRDGTEIPVEVHARSVALGDSTARVVVTRDLRDELAAEALLAEGEARFRALLDVAFDGMVVHRGGYVLDANEGFARMCGYELPEVLGMMPSAVVTPESVAVIADHIGRDATEPYEVEGVRKDGTHFPMQIQGRRVPGGNDIRVTGFRDLTKQREAEAERVALQDQLILAQKLEGLGVMAGGIAHDFNNLLTVILGNVELALLGLDPDSDSRGLIEQVRKAAVRAAELTRQILAYTGRIPPAPVRLDLSRVVRETSELIRVAVPAGVDLELQLSDTPLVVEADPGQLGQVAMNLMTNAAEALEDGAGRVRLRTAREDAPERFRRLLAGGTEPPKGPCALLEVEDTGAGVAPDDLPRIFDPFYTTRFEGRGLGLASVLGILRAHGGAVAVESLPGRGTRFCVLLPLVEDAPKESLPRETRGGTMSGLALVVDDDPEVGAVSVLLLRKLGLRVELLASGEELLDRLGSGCDLPRVVMLDRTMPGMGGDVALERLRVAWPDLPVLVVSGREAPGGAFSLDPRAAFLPKPFTREELAASLDALRLLG